MLLRYLKFCPDFFDLVGTLLDTKGQVDCKTYDVTTWETTTAIHILPNISRNKVKDSEIWSLFKIFAENEIGILVPNFFMFLRKALFEVKASGLQLNFKIFRLPSIWTYKNRLYKTWSTGCWFQDMQSSDFLGLRLISPLHFVYGVFRENVSFVAFY